SLAVGPWPVSSATSVLGWAHSSLIVFPEFSNQQSAKINLPLLPARLQADWVSDEGFPHEALSSSPLDLPIGSDPAERPRPGILQDFPPAPLCLRTVHRRRGLLLQSFVGANLIVNAHPPIGSPLLRASIARRGSSGFALHHSMHLLVSPVLLR